jgi:ribosomal protein S17
MMKPCYPGTSVVTWEYAEWSNMGAIVVTTHAVKCWPEYFKAIADHSKTFDLRIDDRGYQVGDDITFEEFRPGVGEYTGEVVTREIVFILRDFAGLMPGYCILGFAEVF